MDVEEYLRSLHPAANTIRALVVDVVVGDGSRVAGCDIEKEGVMEARAWYVETGFQNRKGWREREREL